MNHPVTVVVPTRGERPVLRRVLAGFDRQEQVPGGFEVIVAVDRAATEETIARVSAEVGACSFTTRVLRGRLPGASSNRNVGWQAADSPLVLFTDDDTVPDRHLVARHLASHAARPEDHVAVAGHVRWAPELRITPFMRWLEWGVQFDFESLSGDVGSWAHLYTSNASIKRAMLERVGGFDEERLPYLYEDLDWGYRAKAHGLQVVYDRSAIVDHHRPATLEAWQERAPVLARAEWQFCQLHPEVRPFFWQRFSAAAQTPAGRGLGARMARFVPATVPVVGKAVWRRAELHWWQSIAPQFMAGWPPGGDQSGSRADSAAGIGPEGS